MLIAGLSLFSKMKKFGPWILGSMAVVFVGFYTMNSFRNWKKELETASYDKGVVWERNRQDKIARNIEKQLKPELSKIETETETKIVIQKEKEIVYVDRISKEISLDPTYESCRISDSLLHDRNELRRSLDSATNTPVE